jgi:predicted NAD-dependent protein-ADP-ribosyltransferase YbiA (DUF1768 family)
MDKNMYYEENRNLEEEDVGYDSPIYTITLYDKHFLLSVGKERKLVTKKNCYYFPVYLMNKTQVQSQIGALEFESKKESKEDRLKPYLDSSGDLDLNRLGDIIFYSFADYDYFHNITIDITPVILSEMETKYTNQALDEAEGDEQDDANGEPTGSFAFELDESDIKKSRSMLHSEKVLKEGVFDIDRSVKRPATLSEETKEESMTTKKEYRERKGQTWIETYMKNNHFDIVETDDNGDCLFDTVRIAYEQMGYKTTIQKLRALVAKEATDSMFTEYRELYQGALGEKADIEKEMRRLVTVNKELKKRLKVIPTSDKDQRNKIIQDANEVSGKHKDLKEKLSDNTTLLSEFSFMSKVDTLEQLREYIQRPSFWADNWAISVLEKELNMKLIIFSESSYNDDDHNNVLQCTMANLSDSTGNFSPDFYIFTTYSGNHYRLITYKNKRIFKFSEIPYDVKIMVVIKCMERNSGIFNEIQDFRNFKSKIGVADESEDDDRDEDEYKDESNQSNATSSSSSIQLDKDTVFAFYNKSSGTAKPGKGANEKISQSKIRDYTELGLKKFSDWRRKLDDDYATVFTLDNMKWKTVEHYYQGAKFKKHNPHFYKLFSLDSDNEIAKEVDIAKAAGSLKGTYKKVKTVVPIRPQEIKIDPDFYGNRKMEEREKALYSKFSQNEDLKAILIATRNAVLKKHVPKSKTETDHLLMTVRKQIQIENNVE